MLLNKGKVARILDKAQDSDIAVKLVEEFRQAIVIYQVCSSIKGRQKSGRLTSLR